MNHIIEMSTIELFTITNALSEYKLGDRTTVDKNLITNIESKIRRRVHADLDIEDTIDSE